MTQNYQRSLDRKLEQLKENAKTPTLLLHACCAPCSSYVLEYLSAYFHITVFFFNPNISDKTEYQKRADELERLISVQPHVYPVGFLAGSYEPERFFEAVRGYESCREGGQRCVICYRLRLSETADMARERGFDMFTTTLPISPLKNAAKLNEIGGEEAERVGVPYLFSDFKKKEGYKRSITLSAEYGLYRQNYCGCVFSRKDKVGE